MRTLTMQIGDHKCDLDLSDAEFLSPRDEKVQRRLGMAFVTLIRMETPGAFVAQEQLLEEFRKAAEE